jgi:phospholipid/cholesterol/gamma-HCH transport system substrate-binding protein
MKGLRSHRVSLALIGLAVLAIVVALAVSARVGGPVLPWSTAYRVGLVVPDAHGLVEDADVLVRGVRVGSVEEIAVAREGTRLVLSLDSQVAPVRREASARVATKTLLEEAFVDLSPGLRGPPLPPGSELAAGQVRETVELDEAIAPLAESGSSGRSLLRSLERGLRSRNAADRLNLTVAELRHFVGEVRTLTETLDGQERILARGVSDMRVILVEIAERDASVRRIVAGAGTVLATVSDRSGALDATLSELPLVLEDARSTLRSARPLVRESRPLVADLRRAAPDLAPALAELEPVAADSSALLRATPRLERAGVPLLRRAEPLATASRPLARELAPALANLVPVVRHLALRRDGVSAFFAQAADLTGPRPPRGRAARVFNVDERGTARGRRGDFANNAYTRPGDASDPRPYEPGDYPRLRPLFVP